MATLFEHLGFKVEDGQVKTFETRESPVVSHPVPKGVRPATQEEIAMWHLLERRF